MKIKRMILVAAEGKGVKCCKPYDKEGEKLFQLFSFFSLPTKSDRGLDRILFVTLCEKVPFSGRLLKRRIKRTPKISFLTDSKGGAETAFPPFTFRKGRFAFVPGAGESVPYPAFQPHDNKRRRRVQNNRPLPRNTYFTSLSIPYRDKNRTEIVADGP